MVTNVLYAPERSQARADGVRILADHKICFRVVNWAPDDPERHETVYLVSSVGEFAGLDGLHFYVNHYRQLQSVAIKEAFKACAAKWLNDTQHFATIYESTQHPAYGMIVSMGEAVVPLILQHLQKQPEHWFWMLAEITKENPAAEDTGDVEAIRKAWLNWGKLRGLI